MEILILCGIIGYWNMIIWIRISIMTMTITMPWKFWPIMYALIKVCHLHLGWLVSVASYNPCSVPLDLRNS